MKSYKDITTEELQFIKDNYRALTFSELSDRLNISSSDIHNVIETYRADFPRFHFKYSKLEDHSDSWKQEVAEYYKTHSLSQTSLYFFTRTDFIREILKIYNIPEHTRAEALNFTRIENYGSFENYVASMVSNSIKTSNERYGVDNFATTDEAKRRARETWLRNHGVDNPMKSPEIKETYKANMRETRGYDWPQQDPEVLAKRIDTCNKLNGGCGWKSLDVREKSLQTHEDKYGSRHWRGSAELTAKVNATCQANFGVDWPCLSEPCRSNINNDSKPNHNFADLLSNNNIEFQREFGIGYYSYDFKVGNTLIEIDPSATHNSTWNPFGGEPFDKTYHKNKTECAWKHGYRCIHVWDWDDIDKIVIQLKTRTRVFARNSVCHEINTDEAKLFLEQYHLQGSVKCDIAIGLFYKGELVSVMTFGKPRYNKNYEYELLRYASSFHVIGGAEKLFKYFVNNYSPESIVSYCDYSKFTGTVYETLGFKHQATNISKHWYNMSNRKHITDNLLRQRGFDQLFGTNFGKGTNNDQLMLDHKFIEIYDAGQGTYIWNS